MKQQIFEDCQIFPFFFALEASRRGGVLQWNLCCSVVSTPHGNVSIPSPLPPTPPAHPHQATVPRQFKLLLVKWYRLHWRSPSYNVARLFTCIIIALATPHPKPVHWGVA